MAEGDQKADPYLQGSFKIGKILHDVSLSSSNFSWTKKGDAVQKAGIERQTTVIILRTFFVLKMLFAFYFCCKYYSTQVH